MLRKIAIAFGVLTSLFVVTTVVFGLTAIFDCTVQIVDSAGNVMDGVASATVAAYNSTVRVVDSTGHVLDSLGLLAVSHDTSLTGAGTPVSPLASNLATDNTTLQGDGRPGTTFQLKAVQHDTSLTGLGTVASPLTAAGSTAGIGGNKANTCGADGWCNVVNFGADPTFVADSEPAFMAAQAAANVLGGSQAMYVPGGVYKMNFPLWIKGTTVNGTSTFRIMGAGGLNRGSFIRNNYVLVMPATGLSAVDAGCGAGVLWTTPLAGAVGKSMCDQAAWWIDLKQLLWNGTANGSIPLNGKVALDAQFWFQPDGTFNTGGTSIIGSNGTDGSVASNIGPMQLSYTWNGSAGQLTAQMNIGGVVKTAATASFDIATAAHFYEVYFSNALGEIRWRVDGVTSGTPTAASGAVTDLAYEAEGLGSGEPWPIRSAGGGFHGELFGLRLSDTVRNTADYTPPTSAITTCDSNTLILLNGTQVYSDEGVSSTSGPFVKPECLLGGATGSTYYYLMHSGALVSNVGSYISGLRIGQTQNSYGIVYNQANESMTDDLFILNINGVGLLEENNSYFSQYNNMNIASTWYDAQFLWPGQQCNNCNFYVGNYPVVDNGGVTYNLSLVTPASSTKACLVSVGAINPFTQELLNQFQCDNEGQFTGSLFNFNGGSVQINSSAIIGGNPSAIRIGNGTNLTLSNNLIVGTATELIAAGFGAVNPQTTSLVTFNSDYLQNFALGIQNVLPPTDGQGEHYEMHGMGTKSITGTTAGTASLSCDGFADSYKSCTVNLVAYRNSSATVQKIMMPAGITTLGFATELTGAGVGFCDGIQVNAGDNADCASSTTYPCCTGAGTGTCDTLQFVSLPINMSGTQSGLCQFQGL